MITLQVLPNPQTMSQEAKQKWDERYKSATFAYGKEPNLFFKEWILQLDCASILLPADGEGRNGVFAAKRGWHVTSFDLSDAGKEKAMQLAKEYQVSLEYIVGDFDYLDFTKDSFEAIGLIYAHFPANKKSDFHQKLKQYLKPEGIIIFEAYSKSHLDYRKRNPSVGGPASLEELYSIEEIQADFGDFEIVLLQEEEVTLHEGSFHVGTGSVVRFVGRKKA